MAHVGEINGGSLSRGPPPPSSSPFMKIYPKNPSKCSIYGQRDGHKTGEGGGGMTQTFTALVKFAKLKA